VDRSRSTPADHVLGARDDPRVLTTVVVQNIQKGPSPWWAVGAGLGAALLLVTASFVVAYYQRRADSNHLRSQLEEAGNRLDRQLEHDRQLRDLEHVRATLQPILARAFMVEPMNRARVEVQAARRDSDRRREQLVVYTVDLMQRATEITTDRLTLGVVLGPLAPLVKRLGDVAETFREANVSVTAWSEGSLADEAVEPQLAEILNRRGDAVAALLISAYETVGWEPPADVA
jgi:hypothetical protein